MWLPLSFIQPASNPHVKVMPEGLVNLVPVRVLPNLKAGTVEEGRELKKTAHLTAFHFLIEELRYQLKLITKEHGAA